MVRGPWIEVSGEAEAPEGTRRSDIHWVYFSSVYFYLTGTIFFLYLARILPATELGAVVVLQAIATIVSAGVSLGLNSGFQHFLSFYRGRNEPVILRLLLRSSVLAAIVLAGVGFALTFGLSESLSPLLFRSPGYAAMIQLLGVYAGLATAMTILQGVVLGLQRWVLYAARSVAAYTLTYGGAIAFYTVWPGLRSIVLGWILGAAAGCALYLGAMGTRSPVATGSPAEEERPSPGLPGTPLYRAVLAYSLPILASALISTSATYVDRLILASISNLANVGLYNYALLFVAGSTVVISPFSTVLLPRISEHFGRGDGEAIRRMTRVATNLIVLVYVPFALAIAAGGPFLLHLLVGPAFVADGLPLAVLITVAAVTVPSQVMTNLASGTRRTPTILRAALLALTANALLSLLLVPRFGILGAAFGNSAMYWGPILVLYLELRGTGLFSFDLSTLGRVWAASVAMALVFGVPLLFLGYGIWPVIPLAFLGLAVLLAALRGLRAIPREVADWLVHVLPHRLSFAIPSICWVAACDDCGHRGTAGPSPPT